MIHVFKYEINARKKPIFDDRKIKLLTVFCVQRMYPLISSDISYFRIESPSNLANKYENLISSGRMMLQTTFH